MQHQEQHPQMARIQKPKREGTGGAAVALAAIVLVAAFQAASPAEGTDMKNLVSNGDFSEIWLGSPAGWETSGNEQNVDQRLEAVLEGGNRYAKLTCTRCEGSGGSDHAMIAQIGGAALEEGKSYEFSCRARAEGLKGRTVNVAMRDTDGWHECGLSADLVLRASWKEFRNVFQATRSVGPTGRLQFWYTEPGTFYLDDVSIVEVAVGDVEFTDVVPPTGGKNLVPNGSFEVGAGGWSSFGNPAGWGNMCRLHGTIEPSGGADGRAFLRVPMGEGRAPTFYFDYFAPVARRPTMALAANLGWIPVEAGQPYTLSCDMRADVDGVAATIGAFAKAPEGRSWENSHHHAQKVRLSTSWQRCSLTFRPAYRYVFVTVGPDLDEDARVDVDIDAVQLERGERATPFEPRSPVEVAVEPSAPGGIFAVGEPAALHLRACNHSDGAEAVRFSFQVADFFGRPVALPGAALEVAPRGIAEGQVQLPGDWRGYYRVRASYDSGSGSSSQDVRLAFVPPQTRDDSVIGINHAFNDAYLIQLARKAGITWYRDWSLKWQHLEPEPGRLDWQVGDVQIDRVLREGVHLMALLPPFPSANWSSTADPDMQASSWEAGRQAWAPKEPQKLAEFVGKAVSRYKNRVKVWEFLNEPIFTSYALPRAGGYEPADYVRLLAPVSAAMRQADPDCKVMGGIAGGTGTYTREVIGAGCLDYVDIFNLHIYPGAAAPESFLDGMDALLALMDEHGGRKPIWMTEFSYYAEDDLPRRPFIPAPDSWSESRLLADERECAEMTIRFCVIMMSRGVEKVFIHSGSSGTVNMPNTECCVFKYGGAPAKVLPAIAVFTDLMGPSPKCVGQARLGEDAYIFGFETGERSVLVCWSAFDEAEVALPEGARCLDFMGNELPARRVPLTPTPIYLIGPPGAGEQLGRSLGKVGS